HESHVPLAGPAAGFAHRQLLPAVRERVEFEPAGNPGIAPLAAGTAPDLPGGIVERRLSPGRAAAHDGDFPGSGGGLSPLHRESPLALRFRLLSDIVLRGLSTGPGSCILS